MKAYFITGTDTNCGKTYVTCQFLDYFHEQQQQVLALKPVASGYLAHEEPSQCEDVLLLQQHNRKTSYAINGWQFKSPISPHLAAKEANTKLTINDIAKFCFNKQFASLDYLLIEGAGGLLVPLNDEETWLDFLKLTQIPVILVVGMRLGCLNHALLTDTVLKINRITCAGWLANCLAEDMLALSENIKTLAQKMHMPLLATIPYKGKLLKNSLHFPLTPETGRAKG
jgi:dethiobiotin synthetase